MFLDEELLLLGRTGHSCKPVRKLELIQAKMVIACMANLNKRINLQNDKPTSQILIANFQRVSNTWDRVVAKLKGEGIMCFSPTAFKDYVKSEKDFNLVSEIIWK